MKTSRKIYFCNNCGKQGHTFNQCKKPIISNGVISFKRNKDTIKYLMICRKDSLGYVEFLRGKYPLYDIDYIKCLIDQMTNDEKRRILTLTFEELWNELWGDFVGLNYRGESKTSKEKFIQIKKGIKVDNLNEVSLESLVKESLTNWVTPEWGFPKGRRNSQETDLYCSLREWEEETGYDRKDLDLVRNLIPFDEIYMSSNFKTYKHRYYLGSMKWDIPESDEFQRSEVSCIKWVTLTEALENIRDYHLEKKDMIINIDKVLHKYRLI